MRGMIDNNLAMAVLLPMLFILISMLIFFLASQIVDYIKEYSVLKIKGSAFGISLAIIAIFITAVNIGLMAIK